MLRLREPSRRLVLAWLAPAALGFTAACGGSADSITGPGESPPKVSLSSTTVQLSTTQGASQPLLASVTIGNAGGGTLSGLAAAVVYPGEAAGAWLSATLAGSVAPTTLQISVSAATLPVGSYTAGISISSSLAGNSPQTVTVSLNVSPSGQAIVSIELASPVDTLLAVGRSALLSAAARNAAGQAVPGTAFIWRSSNPAVVSVDAAGTVLATAPGVALVTAEAVGVTGTLRLRVANAQLTSIGALAGDAFLAALVQGLRPATRSRVTPMVTGLTTAAQQGNLASLLANVTLLRAELSGASDPTDRAVLATIVLFADRIRSLIIL